MRHAFDPQESCAQRMRRNSWRGTCKLTPMMNRATEYRRIRPLVAVVMLLFGLQVPLLLAQEAMQDPGVESLERIRSTAQVYVKSLIPASAGESIVTVGQLDSRLRLARCPPKELSASLPTGMAVQARSTVGVTCTGSVHWTIYVPVTEPDRKSTRLNSSHLGISYAVF